MGSKWYMLAFWMLSLENLEFKASMGHLSRYYIKKEAREGKSVLKINV